MVHLSDLKSFNAILWSGVLGLFILSVGASAQAQAQAEAVVVSKSVELKYAVVAAPSVPSHVHKILNQALGIVESLPPKTMNRIQLRRHQSAKNFAVTPFLNVDIAVHLMTSEEFVDELKFLEEIKGVHFGNTESGTMITNPFLDGPVVIYIVWEELMAEENMFGWKRMRDDAVPQLTMALAKEFYGNALAVHNMKADRNKRDKVLAVGAGLTAQDRVRQVITSLRETIQFINRVENNYAEQFNREEYRAFASKREQYNKDLQEMLLTVAPVFAKPNIIPFASCTKLLNGD